MKSSHTASAVGIAWYREDDYEGILSMMCDRHLLPATYAGWLEAANQVFRGLEASGQLTVKAHLRPEEFLAWCNARGMQVDAKARTQWGNEAAIRVLKESKLS